MRSRRRCRTKIRASVGLERGGDEAAWLWWIESVGGWEVFMFFCRSWRGAGVVVAGEVRRAAAVALGELGPEAKGAVDALAAALQDEGKDVRGFGAGRGRGGLALVD
jgi:hypothetical protein